MLVNSDLRVFPHAHELYARVAQAFIRKITELSQERSRIQLGVSGGSIATKLLPMVRQLLEAHPDYMESWAPIHVWLVDERHVALESLDRTSRLVREHLTERFPIFILHDVPAPAQCPDPFAAAAEYEAELLRVFTPALLSADAAPPEGRAIRLDFALLGLGPDGHFASLFPSHETLYASGLVTAEVDSPKPPSQRVTMSLDFLRRTRYSWFVVSGEDKAVVFSHAVHGDDYREVPASALAQVGTTWWADKAAAARVNPLG